MKFFLFDDVFSVNENLQHEIKYIEKMPYVQIDNFLKNFDGARNIILNTPVGNWKITNNTKNFVDYYDCRSVFSNWLRAPQKASIVIVNNINNEDVRWSYTDFSVNVFSQINNKRSNFAVPHDDGSGITCLLFLNSEKECSGGTAFFEKIKDDDNLNEDGSDYWKASIENWKILGVIPMKPNTLIMFPSKCIHAAWHPDNSFFDFPRLTGVWWLNE